MHLIFPAMYSSLYIVAILHHYGIYYVDYLIPRPIYCLHKTPLCGLYGALKVMSDLISFLNPLVIL